MVLHLTTSICLYILLSLSTLLPTAQGDQDKGLKPRQKNIRDKGYGGCMAGWYDVQGQGAKNDYCRWVGNCGCRGDCSWLSCALAGSTSQNTEKGVYSELDLIKNAKIDYTNCIENPELEGCAKIVSNLLPSLLQENLIKEGEIGVNDGSLSYRGSDEENYLKQWATTLTLRTVGDIKTIKTENEKVTINGTVTGQTGRKRYYGHMRSRPTGLYAGAGDLVTLTFPEDLVGKVSVDIGHLQFIISFPVRSSICKIGSPYGGHIIVRMNRQDSYTGEFEVSVTNAIRAPTFIYGKTTNEQWKEMRHYSPKWSVLRVPGQVDIYVQTLKIKDITDMEASMSRIKNTMDLVEEQAGQRPGSQPGAEILIIDPARGGGFHTGVCSPGTSVCGDRLHTEGEVSSNSGYDAFFKEDGTEHVTLHEFGHGFCVGGFPDMGNQWTAETVNTYIQYVKGRFDKHEDVAHAKMVSKDLDFYILERMVGFAMYSGGKPCGEATFDSKQFATGTYENCWKWLNWLPSKEHGWHIWKDVNTMNAKSTKEYTSGTDRMMDMYCQATQHNMLPMFDLWNIKPLDGTIANNCQKLPQSDLITKWVNIAKCVNQSMTNEEDIRECGKMPRFPENKGLCVMSGVCNEDQTNKGDQTIMNKKFDLYGGSGRVRSWRKPFEQEDTVPDNKESCFKRAGDFYQDCKNTMHQPITATFYEKEQGNYKEFHYTFLPAKGNCFEDRAWPRLMPHHQKSTPTMVPEECNRICKEASYSYFGVQYYSECWCGNNAPPLGKKIDPKSCDTMCEGDKKLRCGGGYKANIWKVCSEENCEFKYD